MKPREKLTISYQVLDENNKILEVVQETGVNRNLVQWTVERRMHRKYKNRQISLRQISVKKI